MDRLRGLLATQDDAQAAFRTIGGLLLGVGMLIVALRRSGFSDPWANGVIFLVLAAPCVFLYGLGMLGSRLTATHPGWQVAYIVFGVLLMPLALFQLLEAVGATPDASLNIAWVFLVTAAAGVAASLLAGVSYGLLLAGLALTVSWMGVWEEVLTDGFEDEDVFRGLLLGAAVLLAIAAAGLRRRFAEPEPSRWNELILAAGVVVLVGPAVRLFNYYLASIFSGFFDEGQSRLEPTGTWAWDAALLLISIALVLWAWQGRSRGSAYLGAVGLALFTFSVGLDADDSSPAGHVVGWPLIILVLGAAAFVASLFSGLRIGTWRSAGGEPPPPAPPPPPAAGQP